MLRKIRPHKVKSEMNMKLLWKKYIALHQMGSFILSLAEMTIWYIINSENFDIISYGNRNGSRNIINEYANFPCYRHQGIVDLYSFLKMNNRLN